MSDIINIYPPIVDTYQTLLKNGNGDIVFNISDFQSTDAITTSLYVHIAMYTQATNKPVLNQTTGIKKYAIKAPDDTHNYYYINVTLSSLLNYNEYYKTQLRFVSYSEGESFTDGKDVTAAEIQQKLSSCSDWSTITLVKKIEVPTLTTNLDGVSEVNAAPLILGSIYFPQSQSTEYISEYNFTLKNSDEILETSGTQYCSALSSTGTIKYQIKTLLEANTTYQIILNSISNGGYEYSKTFTVTYKENGDALSASITATPQRNNGAIKLTISSLYSPSTNWKCQILRASAKDGFSTVEELHYIDMPAVKTQEIYEDDTVESGIAYLYAIRGIVNNKQTQLVYADSFSIVEFDEGYLIADHSKKLKLKFDFKVGSMKRNILESKTDTIGSQFPFIRRNGAVDYRSFGLTGLISYQMDDINEFLVDEYSYNYSDSAVDVDSVDRSVTEDETSNSEVSTQSETLSPIEQAREQYKSYIAAKVAEPHYDYVHEKFFREKVMDFLCKDNVKLFKSLTEGNMLIRLMDIQFTPTQQLGNLTYSFSATAYEIDSATVENMYKYNILNGDRTAEV